MEALPAFFLRRPASVAEAAALLASEPEARLLGGGTDLLPNLRRGIERPAVLIDLANVGTLRELHLDGNGLVLGAGVSLARLADGGWLQSREDRHAGNRPSTQERRRAEEGGDRVARAQSYRAIAEAAREVAGPGHRTVATVGGNLCLDTRCVFYNQSAWWRAANGFCLKRGGSVCHVAPQGQRCHAAFSGDLAPALLALEADVELASRRGTRRIPLAALYRDDGAAHLQLGRDELLLRVLVPAPGSNLVSGYRKARVRSALEFPLAGVAIALAVDDGVLTALRVALTGTNAQPIVLDGTQSLLGRPVDDAQATALGKLVQKQVSPMRTTATPSNSRRLVAAALAQRLLRKLADEARRAAGTNGARR
jgi:4-hydroxybenzoyl-CoA reductase subunit beta